MRVSTLFFTLLFTAYSLSPHPLHARIEVHRSHVQDYAENVLARLLARLGHPPHFASLRFYHSQIPNALLTEERTIMLSTKLLDTINNTGELLFILGHELAHIQQLTTAPNAQDEVQADHLALQFVQEFGYPPSIASALLKRICLNHKELEKSFYTLDHRIARIDRMSETSSQLRLK